MSNEMRRYINIIKHLNENQYLQEYITKDEIYLKDYLSMSEDAKKSELPHEFYYFFSDFLAETDVEFSPPKEERLSNYADEPYEEVDMFDNEIELIIWLESNNPEVYNKFADYLYNKIENEELPIDSSEYPAWHYFSDKPELVKNQWLIHFTKNAESIAEEGFTYGVDDMTKLGLTTSINDFDKKYGGYNFAYLLSDFPKYAKSNRSGYKYGNEAVIFNASGIRVWHYGDEEYQVIFYGNTAKNIIPIIQVDGNWVVVARNGRQLFNSDNLERVVKWLVDNYQQYRKNLHK